MKVKGSRDERAARARHARIEQVADVALAAVYASRFTADASKLELAEGLRRAAEQLVFDDRSLARCHACSQLVRVNAGVLEEHVALATRVRCVGSGGVAAEALLADGAAR